jgi:hypothetical protein
MQSQSHSNLDETFYDVPLDDFNENIIEDPFFIVQQNKSMAIEKIPNFLMHLDLITVDVFINDVKLKALIDTGANCCVFYKKAVDACKIEYLVDRSHINSVSAAQGSVNTYGKIWYLDITIQNYSIPCSFDIIDNPCDNRIQMILGLNFLAAHRINIDFHSRKLLFSNSFNVSFNL